MTKSRERTSKYKRGTAAVEAAVLLPMLVLLTLGMCDLGRFSHAHICVAAAARCGATYGSHSKNAVDLTDNIVAAAKSELRYVTGYSDANPTVATLVADESGGNKSLKVTVSFQFRPLIPYPGLPGSLTLTRAVQMRVSPVEVGDDEYDPELDDTP